LGLGSGGGSRGPAGGIHLSSSENEVEFLR
jgi:hypothetical protein